MRLVVLKDTERRLETEWGTWMDILETFWWVTQRFKVSIHPKSGNVGDCQLTTTTLAQQ